MFTSSTFFAFKKQRGIRKQGKLRVSKGRSNSWISSPIKFGVQCLLYLKVEEVLLLSQTIEGS